MSNMSDLGVKELPVNVEALSPAVSLPMLLDYYVTYYLVKGRSYLQPLINTDFNVDKVVDGLYIGDFASACNLEKLQQLGITHVVTVLSGVSEMYPNHLIYKTLDICDRDWDSHRIYESFDMTNTFIKKAINDGGRVYVHCMCGVSRSATIVAAYLIKEYNMDSVSAVAFIKERRACINPIPAFRKKLKNYVSYNNLNMIELQKN